MTVWCVWRLEKGVLDPKKRADIIPSDHNIVVPDAVQHALEEELLRLYADNCICSGVVGPRS